MKPATTNNRRPLLIALLVASLAAVAVYAFLLLRPASPPAEPQQAIDVPVTAPVLVTSHDLAAGQEVTDLDVEVRDVALDAVHPRALNRPEDAVGMRASVAMVAGEQVLDIRLTGSSDADSETFAKDVPPGMRAMALDGDEVVLVGGLVQPGDRVDVIGYWEMDVKPVDLSKFDTFGLGSRDSAADDEAETDGDDATDGASSDEDDAEYTQYVSSYVVQDIEVLAVAQALTPGDPGLVEDAGEAEQPAEAAPAADGASQSSALPTPTPQPLARPAAQSVTVLVSPEQASRLMLAVKTVQGSDALRMVLRAPGDTTTVDLPPAQLGEIPVGNMLGDADKPIAPSPLRIVDASFSTRVLDVGEELEFTATIKNVSDRTVRAGSGGAPSGYAFEQGQAWDAMGFFEDPGAYRIGLNVAAAWPQPFPYRWNLDHDLPAGASTTVTGSVRLTEATAGTRYWLGIIAEPNLPVQDGVAVTDVTVNPVARVRVIEAGATVHAQPSAAAEVVAEVDTDDELRVVGAESGWYRVRTDEGDGWIAAAAVQPVRENPVGGRAADDDATQPAGVPGSPAAGGGGA